MGDSMGFSPGHLELWARAAGEVGAVIPAVEDDALVVEAVGLVGFGMGRVATMVSDDYAGCVGYLCWELEQFCGIARQAVAGEGPAVDGLARYGKDFLLPMARLAMRSAAKPLGAVSHAMGSHAGLAVHDGIESDADDMDACRILELCNAVERIASSVADACSAAREGGTARSVLVASRFDPASEDKSTTAARAPRTTASDGLDAGASA